MTPEAEVFVKLEQVFRKYATFDNGRFIINEDVVPTMLVAMRKTTELTPEQVEAIELAYHYNANIVKGYPIGSDAHTKYTQRANALNALLPSDNTVR